MEIVTGYVRSNILHHGLYAPAGSPYLAIQPDVEHIKHEGNRNGMKAEAYAASVVDKMLQRGPPDELWEGRLAWTLRFIVQCFPLRLMVSYFSRFLSRISIDVSELVLLQAVPTKEATWSQDTIVKGKWFFSYRHCRLSLTAGHLVRSH